VSTTLVPWKLERGLFQLRGFDGLVAFSTSRSVGHFTGQLTPSDFRRATQSLPLTPQWAAGMEQVHGAHVAAAEGEGIVAACDGLVTAAAGQALFMRSADCVPLIAYDPILKTAGLAHAGWRGAREGIPARLLQALVAKFGSRPSTIIAALGPSIGPCCYEVGPEFESWFPRQMREGRKLDLPAVVIEQLCGAGVRAANIHSSGVCTCCTPADCFSYRREGPNAGRMITCVVIQ
jgi:YfiH family protein